MALVGSVESINRNANLVAESQLSLNSLSSLANDIHRLQEYRWQSERSDVLVQRCANGFKGKNLGK